MVSKGQKRKLKLIIMGMKRLDKIKSDYLEEHYPGNNYTKKDLDSYEFWEKERKFVDKWTDDFPKDYRDNKEQHGNQHSQSMNVIETDLELL